MKNKLFHCVLAFAVCGFLSTPMWARGQAGSHGKSGSHTHSNVHRSLRSNKGGAVRGLDRAKDVQSLNTKADTERGFTAAPGMTNATSNASSQAGGNGPQPKK